MAENDGEQRHGQGLHEELCEHEVRTPEKGKQPRNSEADTSEQDDGRKPAPDDQDPDRTRDDHEPDQTLNDPAYRGCAHLVECTDERSRRQHNCDESDDRDVRRK